MQEIPFSHDGKILRDGCKLLQWHSGNGQCHWVRWDNMSTEHPEGKLVLTQVSPIAFFFNFYSISVPVWVSIVLTEGYKFTYTP